MPVSRRAKQFIPFAAVTGLEEALMMKRLEFSEYMSENTEGEDEERRKEDERFFE